ncbi:hypothetical protein Btru_073102 [Bulinus truncatus]|nr:hypothetical protein Btru_073102 [Bulinus truncatus]
MFIGMSFHCQLVIWVYSTGHSVGEICGSSIESRNIIRVLQDYRSCTRAVQELPWSCTGAVQKLYRSCTGTVLELYWSCIGAILELYWSCIGAILELYWRCSIFSFPLKNCNMDNNHILFVIDCRHEVREQIDFINRTVDYLRYNRNWTSLHVSYMTHEDIEPTSLEVLTANVTEKANEISNQCYGKTYFSYLMHVIQQTRLPKHSKLAINFVFLTKDFDQLYDCITYTTDGDEILEINLIYCEIENVDKALKFWNTEETVILDLSKNLISDSNYLRSLQSMTNLLFSDLSNNYFLRLNKEFVFPYSLEEIDLSYTSVSSLTENCFENLTHLRILNLRHTEITLFENMGLPDNFILDTLNIQGLVMTDVTVDFFKQLTVRKRLLTSDFKLCCQQILGDNISPTICHAPDDAITSCKHIVGDKLKRILVWIVGLLTIAGNGIVLIYRVVWSREKIFQTAYGLFVTGLAVSDLLMGVYLMIIAVVDVVYADVYVVYDASWRKSFLCNFSGFLSTLSSETSTFLIGLITLDRFISISYPFRAHDTSTSLKWKGFISTWVIGFVLALIPAVVPEWQIYSSNGLCLALPLSTTGSDQLPGWEFSMSVYIILNFILFLFIALGQVGLFVNVIRKRNLPSMRHCTERRTQDMNIAKKLAFVAVSDFLCWFPIGIMGILSLIGQEFDKETYAWMAVFVLPVNSALNPMIYTIPVIVDRLKCKS